MSHVPSNLSNEEVFRLTGTLPPDRIVALLDEVYDQIGPEDISRAEVYIQEAKAPFEYEDFLSDVIYLATELRDNCRGANKDTAERLCEMLSNIAQTVFNAVDNSDDLLSRAINVLNRQE